MNTPLIPEDALTQTFEAHVSDLRAHATHRRYRYDSGGSITIYSFKNGVEEIIIRSGRGRYSYSHPGDAGWDEQKSELLTRAHDVELTYKDANLTASYIKNHSLESIRQQTLDGYSLLMTRVGRIFTDIEFKEQPLSELD